MEISEFIEKFAEIFDDTDASTLTPETKFRELDEWSSLSVLSLIGLVDEEFNVELEVEDLTDIVTIRDLYLKLTKK